MLDLFESSLKGTKTEYAEMRSQRREAFSVSVKDGKVEKISSGINSGVCARILVGGSWGFASTTILDCKNVKSLVHDAESLGKASKSKKKRLVKIPRVKPHVDRYETPMKQDPKKESLDFLLELALEADKRAREFSESVVSDTVSLSVIDDELSFANSEGARITQRIVRCFGGAFVVARSNGKIASTYESIGSQAGLEVFDEAPILDAALKAAERSVRIAPKRVVLGGYSDVVLENRIVGLLAHEAVGHTAEADFVHGGSFLAGKVGQKIASEKVTLVDDGCLPSGFGTMKYDDEGTPTEKTVIIGSGVVKGFMHSRETASEFEVAPTGNARAWSFEYDPIIRMRNTYIEIGDQTLEELIEDVEKGFFLSGGGSGEADFNGEFMFGTQEAVKIEKGELGESYRGATISGNAFEVLKKVKGAGRDFIVRVGMCGKETPNYVGMGGPSLRTHLLVGGR
ncbi:MAG: TldD/PmbA family protein [Candidatus Bathyarchaeota archaeon]|nr:TldD/PmbA family protein [Candidatus Bathyarchaeota archaeon]